MQRQFGNRATADLEVKNLVRKELQTLSKTLRWDNSKVFGTARKGNEVKVYTDN